MRRGLVYFGVLALFSVLLIQFASANEITDGVKSFFEQGWSQLVRPLFEFVLGSQDGGGDIFFARIMIFIVLLSLVWIAVSQFPGIGDNLVAVWVVSIAFAILGVRFLSSEWIATVVLPYSAVGVAMTVFFPIVVYFYFVEVGLGGPRKGILRRAAWIFAAVVFVGLFFTRNDVLSMAHSSAYIIAAVACVALLLFDGTIQGIFFKFRLAKVGKQTARDAQDFYLDKIAELPKLVTNGIVTQSEADRRKREYEKKARYFSHF